MIFSNTTQNVDASLNSNRWAFIPRLDLYPQRESLQRISLDRPDLVSLRFHFWIVLLPSETVDIVCRLRSTADR